MSVRIRSLSGLRWHLVLSLLASIALLTAFWLLIYTPSVTELDRLRSQAAQIQERLTAAETVQQRHDATLSSHEETLRDAEELLSRFPREDDLPAIMQAVDKVARNHAARIEVIDYSAVKWEQVLGRVQVTALLQGEYPALAATAIDVLRVLPSARLERMRLTAQYTSDQGGSSGLHVEHVEAQLIFSVWLVTTHSGESDEASAGTNSESQRSSYGDTTLPQLLEGRGQWYPRPVGKVYLPPHDLFRPSAKARKMIELLQLTGRYQGITVTGIARSGSRYIATVTFEGRTYRVQPGDLLGEAQVSAVDGSGVTLSVAGQTMMFKLGGGKQ